MMNILNGRKDAVKSKNIPYEISKEYALNLPSEICPVFGTTLEWGTGTNNTGSFDRNIPELGYIEGNVCWMSKRANILKRDGSFKEIEQLYEWFKRI